MHLAVASVSHPNPSINKVAKAGEGADSVVASLSARNGRRTPSRYGVNSRPTAPSALCEAKAVAAARQTTILVTYGIIYMVFLRIGKSKVALEQRCQRSQRLRPRANAR